MNYRKFLTFMITIFMLMAISLPVGATRYESLNVSNLTVEKTARINGLLQAVANTTGNVWYVHSGTGVDGVGEAGKSQKTPFATLDYAIGRCSANNGDFIIVMAGHAETISAANGWDADVAGITILGLGSGSDMPEFTFTATGSTVAIGAANVSIHNLRFVAGVSAIVMGIAVEAAATDALISDCYFPEPTTATFEFVDAIDLEALVSGLTVQNCIYFNADGVGADHFMDAGNGINTNIKLINNYIYGEFAVAAVWSNDADLEWFIKGGTYTNLTNGQHALEFPTGAATGQIIDVLVRTDVQGTAVDPGSMTMHNVYWDADATPDTVAIPVVLASAGPGSIGAINDATTDSLHGKIGTDTEMGDASLYDMWVLDQVDIDAILADTISISGGTLPAAPTAGSLATFISGGSVALGQPLPASMSLIDLLGNFTGAYDGAAQDDNIKASLDLAHTDLDAILADTDMISGVTLPAAPVANSLASYIASGGTALGQALPDSMSLIDLLGDYTGAHDGAAQDDNIKASLDLAHIDLDAILATAERAVTGSTAVMVDGDTIFTIAGGPIKVIDLVSICITDNDGTASTLQYSADPTVGAAITFSGASASLANFVAGGGVVLNQTGLATAPDLSVVMVGLGSVSTNRIIINEGIITVVIGVGSTTGTWKHYLRYVPLGPGVTVTGT